MSLFRPQFWKIPEISDDERRRLPELAATLERRLQDIAARYPQAVFASSLAVEDMVITDAVCRLKLPIRIITLNTGKLNPETAALIAETNARYQTELEVFYPNRQTAAEFEAEFGTTAMYDSVELRRRCCHIRKIEPLNRAIQGADAWLTGQRREQSATRTALPFAEQDQSRGIDKYNPIFDWSETDVWAYILANNVPYNDLYHQGFPSIGCEPCTRQVKQGEDIRAGRWWWESKDSKECGLHK